MRKFIITYNDGTYAESINFPKHFTEEQIEEYLTNEISEYNENLNKDYHITRKNIIEFK